MVTSYKFNGLKLNHKTAKSTAIDRMADRLAVVPLSKYESYADHHVEFARDILGIDLWAKQREILRELEQPNARVTVSAANGVGKTYVAAAAGIAFVATVPGSILLTTAPTDRQVTQLLWREMRNMIANSKHPLPGELLPKANRWEVGPGKWFAFGFATNEVVNFQGYHAPRIMVIEDEASGVSDEMQGAIEGVLSTGDARLLKIGNPNYPAGHFYKDFRSARSRVKKFIISAHDTPMFTGESDKFNMLISPQWVNDKKEEWGDDSDMYRVRVLGEFPEGTLDTVIGYADVERARIRTLNWKPEDVLEIGIDVARYGDDRTVFCGRYGPVVIGIEIMAKKGNVDVANRAIELAGIWGGGNLTQFKVDDTGVGSGVTDILRANGRPVTAFNAAEKAFEYSKYPNRRSEIWFATAKRLSDGEMDLSRLPEAVYDSLIEEWTTPKWEPDAQMRRKVKSKQEIKEKLKRSPDIADAVNLAFAPIMIETPSFIFDRHGRLIAA